MLSVYKSIALVAESKTTILIQGESGTGKELVARAIHGKGPRAARAVSRRQLRSLDRDPFGERALRLRARGVHRSHGGQGGAPPRRPGRNALSRRDRRDQPRAPGETPSRPAAGGVHAGRGHAERRDGRSRHRRFEPEPRESGLRGPVSDGSVLPAERGHYRRAASPRASGGHSQAHRPFRPPDESGWRLATAPVGEGARSAHCLSLAGERARAREHHRAARPFQPRADHRGRRPAREVSRSEAAGRRLAVRRAYRRSTKSRRGTSRTFCLASRAIAPARRKSSVSTGERSTGCWSVTGWPSAKRTKEPTRSVNSR